MENPNKFLGKLVKVKHLNQVGTIINYSEAHDSFIVNLGMGINNMYSLNQLIFIDNSLNNDLKRFQALSKEELSELLIEQNEQK